MNVIVFAFFDWKQVFVVMDVDLLLLEPPNELSG